MNPKEIKNQFLRIHNEYCDFFESFTDKLDVIFQNNLGNDEVDNIVDWMKEYKTMLNYTKTTLEDFEDQIQSKTLKLTDGRIKENKIFDKVQKDMMPYMIIYWCALQNNPDLVFD